MICWLNGKLLPEAQACVPVTDRGFLYGDGIFETVRVARGRPMWLARHLQRFAEGARVLGIEPPLSHPALAGAAAQLLAAADLTEGVLRIALTRGPGHRGPLPSGVQQPTLLMTLGTLPPHVAERARRGLIVITSRWRKPPPQGLPNTIKHANYLNSILAMRDVAGAGADEALLLAADGGLSEGATSNLFLVTGGTLTTPDLSSGALAGTTRAWLLELARAAGVPVQERRIEPTELGRADEAFMTSAVSGVIPVARIDDHSFAVPGPLTARWMQAFAQAAADGGDR